MKEALLNGKQVELIGEVYDGPGRGEDAGRKWTMVQELGKAWWRPAFMDELEELSKEISDDD